MFWIFLASLVVICVLLSWLAVREFRPLHTVTGTIVGIGLMLGLVLAALGSIMKAGTASSSPFANVDVIPKGMVTILSLFLSTPFLLRCLGVWHDAALRSAMSAGNVKPVKTYDLGDKAAREERYEEAIRIYRETCVARDPADPVPYQRIADALLKLGRPEEAASELRRASELSEDQEKALILGLRAAELKPDSVDHLRALQARLTDPKLKKHLEDRLLRFER